jgi:hypothetical protein
MALLKRNTAAALTQAQEDLAASEQAIADLRSEREQSLADGEVDAIARLDLSIADRERQASVFRDKIPLLESRLATEQAVERKRQRQQAVLKAEEILPQRQAAVFNLGRWARDGLPLIEKFKAASKLPGWPDSLERPYADDVQPARFLRALAAALSDFGEDWNPVDRIADAVEIEAEHSRSAIDDLRLPATGTAVEEAA